MNELELRDQNDLLLTFTEGFVIKSDIEWERAGNGLKKIKGQQKMVKEFFEPMRKHAKAGYDAIIDKRNEYMKPLEKAEEILKSKMIEYETAKEEAARRAEMAVKAQAKAERDSLLAEADKLALEGKVEQAEAKKIEAEVIDAVSDTQMTTVEQLRNAGIGRRKQWRIASVDLGKVPNYVNGVLIRPVDEKEVLRLIKEADGKIEIPGIDFKWVKTIVARG